MDAMAAVQYRSIKLIEVNVLEVGWGTFVPYGITSRLDHGGDPQ
jgi:hypothetical protein